MKKLNSRKLKLDAETVRRLSPDELAKVAGGMTTICSGTTIIPCSASCRVSCEATCWCTLA